MNFAEMFDWLLGLEVDRLVKFAKTLDVETQDDDEFIASETVGEVLDKLIIVHIRTWHLEDKVDGADYEEMIEIQRKLRHLFRTKRPRLVTALNKMLEAAIVKGRTDLLDDEDVKQYGKGKC